VEGNLAESLESYQQTLAIRESFVADYPTNTDARRDLAVGYEKIADILMMTGDLKRALMHFRKSLAIFEALSAADPNNALASRSLSISYEKMGDVSLRMSDATGALNNYRKSLAIREVLSTASPSSVQLRRDLAKSYSKLGATYAEMASTAATPVSQQIERLRQAQSWYQRSFDLWLDLRKRGLLSGDDAMEPDKVSQELAKSKAALMKFQNR
jgi:tetratricopeptide (TPR) repeat protein